MYDFIAGRIVVRKPTYAVIETNGVGYRIDIPLSTFEGLPESGFVKVFTYLKVAEDGHRLFGFATARERDLFQRLVEGVNGLGPSRAVNMLSHVGVEELHRAIEEGDAAALKNVRGIGEKLASRLIVELKGKLPKETGGNESKAASLEVDAKLALVALGYAPAEADRAVRRARAELGSGSRVEELIKRSLSYV
ncbi:MAG: Holliday junction branch migration protein RuvA [Planctomycetes bacterium]|nr:Holliday junction branch migration protein RuvA [Planctomycetota bacterium]